MNTENNELDILIYDGIELMFNGRFKSAIEIFNNQDLMTQNESLAKALIASCKLLMVYKDDLNEQKVNILADALMNIEESSYNIQRILRDFRDI